MKLIESNVACGISVVVPVEDSRLGSANKVSYFLLPVRGDCIDFSALGLVINICLRLIIYSRAIHVHQHSNVLPALTDSFSRLVFEATILQIFLLYIMYRV